MCIYICIFMSSVYLMHLCTCIWHSSVPHPQKVRFLLRGLFVLGTIVWQGLGISFGFLLFCCSCFSSPLFDFPASLLFCFYIFFAFFLLFLLLCFSASLLFLLLCFLLLCPFLNFAALHYFFVLHCFSASFLCCLFALLFHLLYIFSPVCIPNEPWRFPR